MRTYWLSELLLVLYVLLVHGLPALHLGWHRSDHVHEQGALRWLAPRPDAHVHTRAGHHAATAPRPEEAQAGPQARLHEPDDSASLATAPHLALGPLHGQQLLLSPSTLASRVLARVGILPAAAQLAPSLRIEATSRRARAPPASI